MARRANPVPDLRQETVHGGGDSPHVAVGLGDVYDNVAMSHRLDPEAPMFSDDPTAHGGPRPRQAQHYLCFAPGQVGTKAKGSNGVKHMG
eukprot:8364727-Lingulodinium_polyedra.AAC.1